MSYCQWWNPWCKGKRAVKNVLNDQVLRILEEQKKEEQKKEEQNIKKTKEEA
ncbi:hypothetical protein [Enterococcus plantarum]|uniref:hypothetical protein n=1 Tax=Enterococcus plantarum TaxID=1077675 RepID=UPI0015E87DAF|nr:hypothetical protein [Enterococcus plantarum]